MYHSITIGTKNTWDDWHLIPKSRPLVNPPTVKTNVVDIPGGDGALDLSTALSGRPIYKNRTGSWEFIAENGFKEWADLFSEIMTYLHGQKLKAVLEDDPDYYYEGRFSVNEWKSDPYYSLIVIGYDVGPYKKENDGLDENWLWDPFNFETDIVRNYRNLPVDGTLTMIVIGSNMPGVPTIITSDSGISVTFGGETYRLAKGINVIDDIVLESGENELTFSGKGIVTVEYNGGTL